MSFPAPAITELDRPYWDALAAGRLLFQRCAACGSSWLPARAACPACLSPDVGWHSAQGRATVISWVVYHHAYADHLRDRLPYDVTIVELVEGPRLLTNVTDSDAGRRLHVGQSVVLDIETVEGVALARFRIADRPRHPTTSHP